MKKVLYYAAVMAVVFVMICGIFAFDNEEIPLLVSAALTIIPTGVFAVLSNMRHVG